MSLLQNTSKPAKVVIPEKFAPINVTDGELPIPIYQFSVLMDDVTVALFQNVKGMSVNRSVDPLTVGGENNFGREFPGHVSFGHITFEVGLSSSDFFWKWMSAGDLDGYALAREFSLVQVRPNPDAEGSDIFQVVKTWDFFGAFPVSWKISDLAISNSTNIVIETLELSFDYFTLYKEPAPFKFLEALKAFFPWAL
jgi:phage tail-like protein